MAQQLPIGSSIDFLTDEESIRRKPDLVIPDNWERLALQSGIGRRLRSISNIDDGENVRRTPDRRISWLN